uniref:Glycosyltransferase family 92 protein n=1 Tax=Physcomitrium patens TaxID=3218 RepID=A0A7I4DGA3_PHYPA
MEREHSVLKVEAGREKACSRPQLGCSTPIKFSTIRLNIIYPMVMAIVLFLVVTQLLSLSGFGIKFWCTETTKVVGLETQLSPSLPQGSFLDENIDTSSIDLRHGDVRLFKPHGLATYLYIDMSAYRGSPRHFSIVGLTAKSIEKHHKPPYACEWVSSSNDKVVKGHAYKILPDWDYGKLYTVVVITCVFAEDVGTDGEGGELVLYASYGDRYRQPERVVVLTEVKGEYNSSVFDTKSFPYDYVYCGSSVYGNISPQRMREWMAYHAKFFGEKSHFILHDAGGFHEDVRKVLEPWIRQGRVTLQNIRQQEIYDGYYHNQFMVVNDCLFRSRFLANWTFFFDIDEYMYVDPSTTLSDVLNEKPDVSQIVIKQVPIESGLCVADNTRDQHERWLTERLIYRRVLKHGIHYDRKYAVQARHAEATGIHMSMNLRRGKTRVLQDERLRYYHYHGTITNRGR